ncbi:splicing factor YJU2 isoform X3 [Neovison vison]|uniref:splicing factor YJU2 isoform X3 n=1 Tax=Neovison vison TaxID=452646 RepID=UPI001CEFEE4B|nr:splicing factor YJU2 isoform X3 [Neogale vison]
MSERKVLNKYYPPDFDPSKIPKLKLPKDRQYVVRLMAPFNMRCKTCGEYIYKGKKFNARKETVQNEAYLGLPIFRFYIKCTRCLAEITFKTDPENTDYTMEHGATRNFQAEKLLEEEEKRVQKEREDEELNNPMKVLENRTKDSKLEMEVLENLQELKDLNQRQAHVDFEAMLRQHRLSEDERQKQEQEEDERETAALVEEARRRRLLEDSDSEEEAAAPAPPRLAVRPRPTAILEESDGSARPLSEETWPDRVTDWPLSLSCHTTLKSFLGSHHLSGQTCCRSIRWSVLPPPADGGPEGSAPSLVPPAAPAPSSDRTS